MANFSDNSISFNHLPVMLEEVLAGLNPGNDGVYVDCTVGGGGHSSALLGRTGPGVKLIGLDQDPDALAAAAKKLTPYQGRYTLVRANFKDLASVLKNLGLQAVKGILFDLGVSSFQLDNPARGFSYKSDAPLDMRMDAEGSITAKDLVNTLPERQLSAIIKRFGEERWASRIAAFIVRARENQEIKTTAELVDIVKKAVPAAARRAGPHPAKRTFQALRIAVNNELEILPEVLKDAANALAPGGRLCVITFHSLEDRITKETLKELAYPCKCPPSFPVCTCGQKPEIRLVNSRPVTPTEKELNENPRARSAKLRVAEKICSVLKDREGE